MKKLEASEKPLGKWDNIDRIMRECGYVYNPAEMKWYNHDLRTAWSMNSLTENFASETEFEEYARKQAADPSSLRNTQRQIASLMDEAVKDKKSPSKKDN
ncbi:MAG: hypothetical protein NT009_09010 [Proteobacteria bacterium]|nr:hypothetical protein [Pseudomonadota bacterium]